MIAENSSSLDFDKSPTFRAEFFSILRQEGRGIGLANKIRAYALQEKGLDTVDANLALGFRDDERDYGIAAAMLRTLGVRFVKLMTNNPDKVEQLRGYGLQVTERLAHETAPGALNRKYLETKANRCGHIIDCLAQGRVTSADAREEEVECAVTPVA